MRIGFIGFGEAARAFHQSLKAHRPSLQFQAYDILLEDERADGPMAGIMLERGVAVAASVDAAIVQADWIISAVTADQSLAAVKSATPSLKPGQIFIDLNSVSPDRKRQSAAALRDSGAVYIDMAVMAPVHPKGHRTPVLLAGAPQSEMARFTALDFDAERVGDEPGQATAIKMVRSLFVKGLEAITVEALLAASASGCLDYTLNSLEKSYPGLDWPNFRDYQFERTLRHGKRRAAEMQESAATIAALGLYGPLGSAIAEVQDRMGRIAPKSLDAGDYAEALAKILALRRGLD